MDKTWLYAILSTLAVSAISLIGIALFAVKSNQLQKALLLLISFSVGAMLGNSFFYLIPESYSHIESFRTTSWLIVGGFMMFFLIEQLLHKHQSEPDSTHNARPKPYGYLSLYADGIHNFTDGVLIGAAWIFSPELGAATTLTVMLHEIPQEISDFGILLKAGFSKNRALLYNFLAASTAILGTLIALWLGSRVERFSMYILPLAAGGFVYLAAINLLPEVLKQTTKKSWLIHSLFILLGVALMYYFSLHGTHQH